MNNSRREIGRENGKNWQEGKGREEEIKAFLDGKQFGGLVLE